MDGNFAAFCPRDPIFTALKDINLLKKYIKNQKAGSILSVIFGLKKTSFAWGLLNKGTTFI